MADYNVRGNKVANAIYDKLLKPEETPPYDGPIPAKPAGLDELPPSINMTAAPIKNLPELKTKTPQEQYEHDIQMKNPASAYTRKEKEDLKNLVEAAEEAGVLKDDADLASQTPAGEAYAGGILPGDDGWVNQKDGNSSSSSSTPNPLLEDENKAEAERKAKEEAERKAKEEAERKAKEEAERKAKEEAERKAKEKGKYRLRSIMDAYNEGLLDEKSRDYLIVDALSKFARNTGKDLANLSAAYTGGSMNNDRETSIWEDRNKAMAEKGIGAEGNQFRANDPYDLNYQSQKLDLAKKKIQMVPAQNFQKAAESLRNSGNDTGAAIMDLIAAASTQGVDPEEYIAAAYANDPNVKKLVDSSMGAFSNMVGVLGDLTSEIEEIVKSARGKAGDSANKSTARRVADAAFGGNPLYNTVTNYMDNNKK